MDQETQNVDQQPTSISLQDLVYVVNFIRVVSERGAVRAEEMSTVGTLYEKLVTFLQSSGAIKSPDQTEQ
jgi:hypothetical protein